VLLTVDGHLRVHSRTHSGPPFGVALSSSPGQCYAPACMGSGRVCWPAVSAGSQSFTYDGHRLVYDEYGKGARAVVLLPGLLFSRRMHRPLAETLAERGHRVICLDPLGHGESDRPEEMWNYSMVSFGAQTLALLDHLELRRAVLGGTSLGANAALEAAAAAPDRVRGLLLEMPVLDNALLGCALAFTPLLAGLTFGAPVTRGIARGAGRVPRGSSHLGDMILDWLSQDPKPSASVLQGLFFGRTAPPRELRRKLKHRTLVIGHGRDPIHPFSDSDMLVREMPNARLVQASSFLELRLTPERLTGEIVAFVEECFAPRSAAGGRRRAASSSRRSAHPRS
jgi:pimeloyl-ACP methyl ester carboxylesterase